MLMEDNYKNYCCIIKPDFILKTNGAPILCHKSILQKIKYFNNIFSNEYSENKNIFLEFDNNHVSLFKIINYFYSGIFEVKNDEALECYLLIDKYCIDELKGIALEQIYDSDLSKMEIDKIKNCFDEKEYNDLIKKIKYNKEINNVRIFECSMFYYIDTSNLFENLSSIKHNVTIFVLFHPTCRKDSYGKNMFDQLLIFTEKSIKKYNFIDMNNIDVVFYYNGKHNCFYPKDEYCAEKIYEKYINKVFL